MQIPCECGYVARGVDDEELVADAQTHARDVHRVDLTAELVVAMAGALGRATAETDEGRHAPDQHGRHDDRSLGRTNHEEGS